MIKELICIACPNGCHLSVDENLSVSGNRCPRGAEYARNEVTHPMRSLTSTAKLKGSKFLNVVPVRTSGLIPKEKMFDVMKEINKISVDVPVRIGQVLIKNVLDLGVDIICSRSVDE